MADAPLAVVIVGAEGRMGRFAGELLARSEGFEVVAALDVDDDLEVALPASGATLGLEVTVAGRGCAHGLALLAAGIRPVIGTSGVSLEENAALDVRARELRLGGLVVPNFSLGIQLLHSAVLLAASHLSEVAIVEEHHTGKVDAPSGTAADIAERLAALLGRAPGSIPIESLRADDRYAHHEVRLAGAGEALTVRHDMSGPEAFAPGLLLALRHAARAEGVGRGLGHALEAR